VHNISLDRSSISIANIMPIALIQGRGLLNAKDMVYTTPEGCSAPEKRGRKQLRCLTMNTAIRKSPMVEAPRAACPRNGSAFSYDPAHLPAWYMPEDLWAILPTRLADSVAAVQHAHAAVFTGFDRLESLGESLPDNELPDVDAVPAPEHHRPRGLSTISALSSTDSDSTSSSLTSSMVSTPLSAPTVSPIPISSFSLSPFFFEQALSAHHHRHHERSYTTPMSPHSAYYSRELSYLRTDTLPNLRHALRVVDRELNEAKRLAELTGADLDAFENWWAAKKALAMGLDQKGQALSLQKGIPANGFGWSA
jgi:hypothetical protein